MSRIGVLWGRSRLAVAPHTHRIVLLKLSVWAARERKGNANLSRVLPGSQDCVGGTYQVEERDDEAGGGYISAEASAGETKCRGRSTYVLSGLAFDD